MLVGLLVVGGIILVAIVLALVSSRMSSHRLDGYDPYYSSSDSIDSLNPLDASQGLGIMHRHEGLNQNGLDLHGGAGPDFQAFVEPGSSGSSFEMGSLFDSGGCDPGSTFDFDSGSTFDSGPDSF